MVMHEPVVWEHRIMKAPLKREGFESMIKSLGKKNCVIQEIVMSGMRTSRPLLHRNRNVYGYGRIWH